MRNCIPATANDTYLNLIAGGIFPQYRCRNNGGELTHFYIVSIDLTVVFLLDMGSKEYGFLYPKGCSMETLCGVKKRGPSSVI